MKIRVLYREDGGVGIVRATLACKKEEETEDEFYTRVFDKATPEGVEFEDVDDSLLPTNREDRNFWKGRKGEGVSIDTAKKEQQLIEKETEAIIKDKIRKLAIKDLKKEGKIPTAYKE